VKGNEYRDLVASYVDSAFAQHGLAVYTEVALGKSIIGKDRQIDVFVVRATDQRALAIECKYQDVPGTADEKIPYALADLAALWLPGCLVYAGGGWSRGVLHTLEGSKLAAHCTPSTDLKPSRTTRELDHVLAATFGLWDLVIPTAKRFRRPAPP